MKIVENFFSSAAFVYFAVHYQLTFYTYKLSNKGQSITILLEYYMFELL